MRKKRINLIWLFKMAWRDSRRNRSRLFLFTSSIILGIAALVAIYSFGDNLRRDIDNQAAGLLGADLVISTNKPVTADVKRFLDSISPRAIRSEQRSFVSMVLFPANGSSRLVQVRALTGGFPYYGNIETLPASAGAAFRNNRSALVDKTVMLQFNSKVGDSIKVGEVTFRIAGILNKAPGQTGISSSVAPVVYIPLQYLTETKLMQKGSRITSSFFYKFSDPEYAERLVKRMERRLEYFNLDNETIESQKRDTGRSFADLTDFLSLVGFIALLLGCTGVASAVHIYIREKIPTIAILRCLGAKGYEGFLIYLIQIAGIGLIGSVCGALLGTLVQYALPVVLKDLLPVTIAVNISWPAIIQGIGLGTVISVLFGLLPLVSIRNISPLNTLRISSDDLSQLKDPVKYLVYLLIVLFIALFSFMQLHHWKQALYFTIAVITAFLVLAAVSKVLIFLVRRFFPFSWGYLWRQGLANLFRPNNQTLILVVSIGLGTMLIGTLLLMQNVLLDRVTLSSSGNQPNMLLFDIQKDQKDAVAALTRSQGLPVLQEVPIITVRLEEVNGYTAADVRKDSTVGVSRRAFSSELRVTYRDSLTNSEKITDGQWHGKVAGDGKVYVSLEEEYAKRINVEVGDNLLFNVQGALIPASVGSLRQVNWNRIQTNFRVLFPTGVLEQAPRFYVILTRVPSSQASAALQQTVVRRFPNVSIIDLNLVLSVLDEILDKIGFVIRFMAGFSIITGLVVLVASVLISKYQRIRESVLLRTLGASRRQILFITIIEYFFLGSIAALTGILLSVAGSWMLVHFVFETSFILRTLPLILLFLMVPVVTILIGIINSWNLLNKPPLEVLRSQD